MTKNNIEVEVLWEDNHLLAVNKPPGMLVQPDLNEDFSLESWGKNYLAHKYDKPGAVFLGICHRLDRPVSGVVLMSRTSKALVRLNEQFKQREPKKIYHVLVEGAPKEEESTLVHWLVRHGKSNTSRVQSQASDQGQRAELSYKILEQGRTLSLLEVQLKTGRHHQIRAQLSAIGCPVVGDVKYGARRGLKDRSIALHAYSLEINHPVAKTQLLIQANYPPTPTWSIFNKGK
ncbi:MAG: RluA family pseudouridine synthase [Bacteroidetes bacterium]|nr:RluA family pseudouridine synthase [Bacteroidota bacterium]